MGIQWKLGVVLPFHCFQIELEFRNVGFCGGRKTGVLLAKNPRSKDENRLESGLA